MKYFLPFFLILFSKSLFSQVGAISGAVQDKSTKERYVFQEVKLKVVEKNRTDSFGSYTVFSLKSTETNIEGGYLFDSLIPGSYTVFIDEIWSEKLPFELSYNVTVKANDTINIILEGEFECSNANNISDRRCPKCQKKNEVIPIVHDSYIDVAPKKWGKPQFYLLHTDRYLCDPYWYCKRDKFQF